MRITNSSLLLAVIALANYFSSSSAAPIAEPNVGAVAVNVVGGVVSGVSGAYLGHRLAKSSDKKAELAVNNKPVRGSTISNPTHSEPVTRNPESVLVEAERKLQEAEKIRSELQKELELLRRERQKGSGGATQSIANS
ncbi:hypothetical protein BKA69DRAFT_1125600 [Paraphysoderma sedebokerense]|nr:hypothetical protein BKA69DRAFT_1125600 [Paraphysoderma sedebokerense]